MGPDFTNLGDAIKDLALLLANDLDPQPEATTETAPAADQGAPVDQVAATNDEAAAVDVGAI